MEKQAVRTHEAMVPVLMHREAKGPDVHYYMIRGGKEVGNVTVWETGTVGGEYIKTFGHYHKGDWVETYRILSGEGIALLQKRKEENGVVHDNEIAEFRALRVKAGDTVVMEPGFGHLIVNTGKTFLVTIDDSPVDFEETEAVAFPGHADYAPIEKLHGFAYYVVEESGEPVLVKNPAYGNVAQIETNGILLREQ